MPSMPLGVDPLTLAVALSGAAMVIAATDVALTAVTKLRADQIHGDLEPATQTAAQRVLDEVVALQLDPETYLQEHYPDVADELLDELELDADPGEMRGGHDPEELAELSAQARQQDKAEELAAEAQAGLEAAEAGIPPELVDEALGMVLDEDQVEYLQERPQVKAMMVQRLAPTLEGLAEKAGLVSSEQRQNGQRTAATAWGDIR